MGRKSTFAVLHCAEDSDHVKKKYGGYFGVFATMLAEEGETWDVYHVVRGEFPSDDQIERCHGFVITGSCHDAHGNDAWICQLLTLLKKLDCMKKKVLGICFGHQILSRSLGGKSGRSPTGWDIGVRTLTLSSSSSMASISSNLKLPTQLNIIECHQDQVTDLPVTAEILAWSDKTGIEMFLYGDHMMGIQGHPEYNFDILLHLVDRLTQRKFIMESFADEVRAKLDWSDSPERDPWRKLCISFLKGTSS